MRLFKRWILFKRWLFIQIYRLTKVWDVFCGTLGDPYIRHLSHLRLEQSLSLFLSELIRLYLFVDLASVSPLRPIHPHPSEGVAL